MKKFLLVFIFSIPLSLLSQNANSLYLISEETDRIYDISTLTGTLPTGTSITNGRGANLALGRNPGNTAQYIYTYSGSAVDAQIFTQNGATVAGQATTAHASLSGFGANGSGEVYGITADKKIAKVLPNSVTINSTPISGDAFWNAGTVSTDVFFDTNGKMYTIVLNPERNTGQVYAINILTNSALPQLTLTPPSGGVFPYIDGLAFYNNAVYILEYAKYWDNPGGGNKKGSLRAHIYAVNLADGIITLQATYIIDSYTDITSTAISVDFDIASSQLMPVQTATCSELFGVKGDTQTIYKINLSTLAATQYADGPQTTYGNLAFGPIPGNTTQKQFVTTPNDASGAIYTVNANTPFPAFVNQGTPWGSPIGLATHPVTGTVYGISSRTLTVWTGGSTIATSTIAGDSFWNAGVILNDLAVASNLLMYTLVSDPSDGNNVWLYRIDVANVNAPKAVPVIKLSGTYPRDMSSGTAGSNANGLAYVGNYFYFSRITGTTTQLWELDGKTGVSRSLGTVGLAIGDLASCSDVTSVHANPCTKPFVAGAATPSKMGITALGRAGEESTNGNWPMVRRGAHLVLEANTKGMVINRLDTNAINNLSPAEGMLVYDTTVNCLKINTTGTAAGWKCIQTQTCPD